MFHCHNLIHEDHEMMMNFNVTALPGFGYKEKTRFLNPMESKFRAVPYKGTDIKKILAETLPNFIALEAYANLDTIKTKLNEYHAGLKVALKGGLVNSTAT